MNEKIIGGGHVGPYPWLGLNASFPFASLTVAPEGLIFKILWSTYSFEKHSVILARRRILFWSQLVLIHTNPEYPKSIIFGSLDFQYLAGVLAKNGYALVEQDEVPENFRSGVEFATGIGQLAVLAGIAGIGAAVVGIAAAVFAVRMRP